jgi:hypothetical protein
MDTLSEATTATLERIRDELRAQRDRKLELIDLEDKVKQLKAAIHMHERTGLVDMFHEAGIDTLGLPPEGNQAGYNAELKPFYQANIAASWPEEKKEAAYTWLEKNGAGDIIKATITVRLPLKSNALRKKVVTILNAIPGLEFTEAKAVPHSTLTAYIKNIITKKKQMPPLDVLGADVGYVVKMEERKPEETKRK